MKTIFALALAISALLGFSACESDDVAPTMHTTTTTEETSVRQPATSTSTTIRSY
jgi:hypothetical protein